MAKFRLRNTSGGNTYRGQYKYDYEEWVEKVNGWRYRDTIYANSLEDAKRQVTDESEDTMVWET